MSDTFLTLKFLFRETHAILSIMKLSRENIQPDDGSSFASLAFDLPEFDPHYHYHPEIEITWILKSEGQRLIGDTLSPFSAGDFVLIGSNVPHQFRNWENEHAHSMVIQFKRELFGDTFLDLPEFEKIKALLDNAARGLSFSDKTRAHAQNKMRAIFKAPFGPSRIFNLLELLQILSEDENSERIASSAYSEPVKLKKIDRLQRVLNFLETNWQDQISLEEAAKVAALHPQSMSRFFRQHLGMNFQEYLIQLRISRAARLLLETEETVVNIAFQCGFNNLANFNRHFQSAYKMPPSAYRRK